jgi:hypothetical protein
MSDDKELIARLRRMDTWLFDTAADRIKALTEQLAAAQHDAKEAEAYAEEVEADRKKTYEALLKVSRIHGEVEAKLTLMMTERDEAWKRAAHAEKMWGEAEVKLAKAVAALGRAKASIENGGGGGVVDVVWLDGPCPETLCDFIDATLAEIKGESYEALPDLR